ncbi:alpha/beta fold hydrolase [Brevibacterium sp. UCMA 11754]|uniref:alpha/beta fold hydrolase n=1 Tax=Brevibacterium sp. UCMA 11754 TaxID=2749198 RepID=UPI001F15BE7D|nr:alpha/beta hydrolase [Brevibacterium sp. UCMA 11754]MCF2573982.1 alpha/beta hydrolase [Brevibacterium sp. UCMA 11754]
MTSLHTEIDGPATAPPLLLIHGSTSSSRSWDSLVPLLQGSHRTIRMDLLGFGQSDKPDGDVYQVTAQADRIAETLSKFSIAEAVVVGHSSGGLVATALAERHPEMVTALALINTGPNPDAFIAGGGDSSLISPDAWPPSDEQLRDLARPAFSRSGFDIPQVLLDDVRRMTFHSLSASMKASNEYLRARSIPDRLTDVNAPLFVIFGQEDRRWSSSSAEDYRRIAGAALTMLPGIGHSPNLEAPESTAELLSDFTNRTSQAQLRE